MSVRAESVDEENRSVRAVFATEGRVTVYDWANYRLIDEVLRVDGAEIPQQVPMLANHSRWSLDDVLGSGREMKRDGAEITGGLFFAEGDEDAERSWNKVRQGHLRDVSVGYRVSEFTDIAPGKSAVVGGRRYTAEDRPLRVATRWALKEVSLVPIGADEAAKIRHDQGAAGRGRRNPEEGQRMDPKLRAFLESIGLRTGADDTEAQAFFETLEGGKRTLAEAIRDGKQAWPPTEPQRSEPPADPPPAPGRSDPPADDPDPAEAARLEGQRAERQRQQQLRELAGDDVPQEVLQRAIEEDMTQEQASALFLSAIRDSRQPPVGRNAPAGHSRSREQDVNVRSLAAAMLIGQGLDPTRHALHRGGRGGPLSADQFNEQDADRGHELRSLSAADLVRECVLLDTGRHYRTVEQALEAMSNGGQARSATVSGGSLSYVFSTNVYARLLAGWETVGDTTAGWCDEEDVANFLEQEDISLSADAALNRLPRGDTAKHATVSDSHETYKIGRYAKQFVVDEQDVIDDRLGAILRMPQEMGESARQLRPDMVYSLLLENPTMSDTGAAFNATAVTTAGGHANLGTAALGDAALKDAITAMVKQRLNRTTNNPGRQLTIRPKFLIVPAALEWTARGLTSAAALAKLFADSSDPIHPMLNLIKEEGLRTVPDDRIGAIGVMDPRSQTHRTGLDTNWFLTSGGNRGLRVAYRRGTGRRPQMRQFVLDRGQWGIGWDINMDIGVCFTEWKTWYKSTGAGG